MSTKTIAMLAAGLWVVVSSGACQPTATPAPAGDDGPAAVEPEGSEPAEPKGLEQAEPTGAGQATAVYQVGSLDADTIKQLNQALVGKDCVLATKPVAEQDRFEVTYRADQCCPNSIKARLAAVRPEVKLEGAGAAAPTDQVDEQGSCGGCPYKNTCDKQGE